MSENTTTVASGRVLPLRFVDGDRVRAQRGAAWWRGLRTPGVWEEFPLAEQAVSRSDDQVRALLAQDREDWLFVPVLPAVTAALPGAACTSAQEIRDLRMIPASGAALFAARLGRTQSFLGDEQGVFRDAAYPVRMRPADVRATLEGVLARHAGARVTFHRFAGRAYARYVIGSTLHTHIHVLTR